MNVWGWLVIAWFAINVTVGMYQVGAGRPVFTPKRGGEAVAYWLYFVILYGTLIFFTCMAVKTGWS